MTIRHLQAKSILQKSGLPDVDWVVNPYAGCQFACKYCYAAFVARFKHPDETWGSFVDVKTNAPELLRAELSKKMAKANSKDIGSIFFSSVTDPYQQLEGKYKLTQHCLTVLAKLQYQGKVSILTKSTMVTRDLDLLKQLPNLEVGITITSTGDAISQYLETEAPPHQSRLDTLKYLSDHGLKTYAFVGPLLPHFVWQEHQLRNLLNQIKVSGASYVYMEHLNLNKQIKERLFDYLRVDYPQLLKQFIESTKPAYRQQLDEKIRQILADLQLPLAHEQAIYHQDKEAWQHIKNNK